MDILSFFAAANGASCVVYFEPDAAGCSKCQTANFARVVQVPGRQDVILAPQTLQEFDSGGLTFDSILTYNAITSEEAAGQQ
jgi:hypothetical protein